MAKIASNIHQSFGPFIVCLRRNSRDVCPLAVQILLLLYGFLVQREQVSSKGKESNAEYPSESLRNIRTSDVFHCLVELRKNVVDHLTTAGVLVGSFDV